MENYYYNLANLPETYNKEQVVKFLGKHNILACEVGNAPRNKHIGSGAWHDDVLAFLIENFQQEQLTEEQASAIAEKAGSLTEEDFKELSEEELKEVKEAEFIDSTEHLLSTEANAKALEESIAEHNSAHSFTEGSYSAPSEPKKKAPKKSRKLLTPQ